MALLATRKSTLRKNGIARRQQLLDAAIRLLETHELDAISLGDVATEAGVPKGSAYYFYEDIKDLYAALLVKLEEELVAALNAPIRGSVRDWQHMVEMLNQRGVDFCNSSRPITQLELGPKVPADLKLRIRQHDMKISGIYAQHIAAHFTLPDVPDLPNVFYRAVEIADVMFALSVAEHGRITPAMAKEASLATCAYLRCYLPETLPRRTGK